MGYAEAGAIGVTTFQGGPVDPLAVLVRQTVSGDANLDGRLTADDFARLDRGFARHLTGWINGDFNYDNVVNAADYQIINAAWAAQQGAVLASAAVGGRVAADVAAVVPEPPVALLLGGAMILMLRRPQRLRLSGRAHNAFR